MISFFSKHNLWGQAYLTLIRNLKPNPIAHQKPKPNLSPHHSPNPKPNL